MSGYIRQLSHISFAQGPSSVLQLSPNQIHVRSDWRLQLRIPISAWLLSTISPQGHQLAVMEGWNYINADWLGQVLFLTLFPSSLVLIPFFLQVIFKSCNRWSFDPRDSEPYAMRSSLCGS